MLPKLCDICISLNFLFVVESEASLGYRGYVLGNISEPLPRFDTGLGRFSKPRPRFYLGLGEAVLAKAEACEAQPRASEDPDKKRAPLTIERIYLKFFIFSSPNFLNLQLFFHESNSPKKSNSKTGPKWTCK